VPVNTSHTVFVVLSISCAIPSSPSHVGGTILILSEYIGKTVRLPLTIATVPSQTSGGPGIPITPVVPAAHAPLAQATEKDAPVTPNV